MYLYRIQPARAEMLAAGPTPEEERVIGEHFNHLERLTQAGTVLLAGRTLNTDPSSFGIVLLNVEEESTARSWMVNDPAVARGVMRAELFPFRLALVNPSIAENV